jgi:hypothetical protein
MSDGLGMWHVFGAGEMHGEFLWVNLRERKKQIKDPSMDKI